MAPDLENKMHRNIRLYGPYQVFTKRVFLPLVAIYASQSAGLSIAQIGYIGALATTATILFETTTGFWADTYGRRNSSRVGSFLAALGTLLYIVSPNLIGIAAASVIVAMGYSFLSGAMAALIHDSLVVLQREDDFPKVASRAQSLSLILNAGMMAAIPALYPIDPRLPFVIGALAYIILFFLASLLTEPPINHAAEEENRNFLSVIRHVLNRKTLLFFITSGFMYSAASGVSDLFSLGFVDLGVEPGWIGLIFAAGSLAGAALGYAVHYLKRLSFRQYVSIDVASHMLLFLGFGFSSNRYIAIICWLQNMAWWRFQRIMYQHYMSQIFKGTRYKATLFSLVSNFSYLHSLWLVLLFTGIADKIGVINSLRYAVLPLLVFWPLLIYSIGKLERNASASRALSNQ
jgi:MFS family permease